MPDALVVKNLQKIFTDGKSLFGRKKTNVFAVRDLSLTVKAGDTLGIVGESGCGKSTLARMLVGLLPSTSGEIFIDGHSIAELRKHSKALCKTVQYIFQDPISSLNPRKTIRETLEAPMTHLHGMSKTECASFTLELLDAVNLRPEFLDRYPHEFSGGQAQRIGIARALAAKPQILILDEPVSALDVSVQAQVLNLLAELKQKFNLTYIFISHDLGVVEAISDNIAVMYFGSIVEIGASASIFSNAKHPYTELLAASAPVVGKEFTIIEDGNAELPDPLNPPIGCSFLTRCSYASNSCRKAPPELISIGNNHETACYHPR